MKKSVSISGTGCCLVDQIYPDIDFSSTPMEKYLSKRQSDGGLYPGRLVFAEQFENFSNTGLANVIKKISRNKANPALNVGGPSIVALIHTAQLLQGNNHKVQFYGTRGNDKAGEYLQSMLEQTPVALKHFAIAKGSTPSTLVLSDPDYQGGEGERIFINDIGAAWNFGPDDLPESFFESDMVVFGGTALVPGIHKSLTRLLKKSRKKGAITVVNTVYDFQNELENPGQRWPLGESDESYQYIDLLITDREEAEHLSGKNDLSEAGVFFMEKGVSAYIITNGTEDTLCQSGGQLFCKSSHMYFPVSASLAKALSSHKDGDTTGCGDNFVGGVLASMAWQLSEGKMMLDLEEAIAWGTVSGGYGCFTVGGCIIEQNPGEKLSGLKPYYEKYREQING